MLAITIFAATSFGTFHNPYPTIGIESPLCPPNTPFGVSSTTFSISFFHSSLASSFFSGLLAMTEAKIRRGRSNGSRECITRELFTTMTSPFSQGSMTLSFSIKFATSSITDASHRELSPSNTALVGSFRESTHPKKAATMELKKTFFCVFSSVRTPGRTAVVVLRLPDLSHSNSIPNSFIFVSAVAFISSIPNSRCSAAR
mmetsp:Transcript_35779/g.55910  ORF Transcript_35779/g.55910 Transcript_35779/m.55910 type:complete len:201 (+) Transcript_35779:938-1540(+)